MPVRTSASASTLADPELRSSILTLAAVLAFDALVGENTDSHISSRSYGCAALQGTAPSTPEGAATSPRKQGCGVLRRDMIRTSVQGNWTPYTRAYECHACTRVFSTLVRKHHCRGCGEVFCDACTTPRVLDQAPALVHVLGATRPQRLCAACKACMPEPAATAGYPPLRAPSLPSGDGALASADASASASPAAPAAPSSPTAGTNTGLGGTGSAVTLQHVVATVGNVVDTVTMGTASPVASVAGDVVAMASASGVVDMAGQALSGLLAVAARFPLGSQCCGLLKDMFALYQVCCCTTSHTGVHIVVGYSLNPRQVSSQGRRGRGHPARLGATEQLVHWQSLSTIACIPSRNTSQSFPHGCCFCSV